MWQTLKQQCWFSRSGTSESRIPVLENLFKLIPHIQQIIDLLLDLLEFVFRHRPDPMARNLSSVTHSQDGRQLIKRKAHLQRTLD